MGAAGSQRTACRVSGCKSTMIHLDTSFLIRALVPGSPQDKSLRRWLESGDSFVMSTIAWAEFLCGPLETRQADFAERVPGTHRARACSLGDVTDHRHQTRRL